MLAEVRRQFEHHKFNKFSGLNRRTISGEDTCFDLHAAPPSGASGVTTLRSAAAWRSIRLASEALRGEPGALGHGSELRPHHGRMDLG